MMHRLRSLLKARNSCLCEEVSRNHWQHCGGSVWWLFPSLSDVVAKEEGDNKESRRFKFAEMVETHK